MKYFILFFVFNSAYAMDRCQDVWIGAKLGSVCITQQNHLFKRQYFNVWEDLSTGLWWTTSSKRAYWYFSDAASECNSDNWRLPTGWSEVFNGKKEAWYEIENGTIVKKADQFPDYDSDVASALKHGIDEVMPEFGAGEYWSSTVISPNLKSSFTFGWRAIRSWAHTIPIAYERSVICVSKKRIDI